MPSYVIVGASRGLGYEWLRNLSADSSNTVIGLVRKVDLVQEQLANDQITGVHILPVEMTDHASLTAAAAEVSKITGDSLDVLIVNGGYDDPEGNMVPPTAFKGKEDLLRKDMFTCLEVNVLSVIYSFNAFLPLIRKGKSKKMIATSAGLADLDLISATGNPLFLGYTAMKGALNVVVAKYGVELRGEEIVVLALSPGMVMTKEKILTPKEIEDLTAHIQTLVPNWKGPLTPAESVKLQKQVIDHVGVPESGAFLSHHGNKEWM